MIRICLIYFQASLCSKFDIGSSASLSFSYGDFPQMQPHEEYQVEICLNDRNGPTGQKCHMKLPCEVHRVHTGAAIVKPSEITS